jgi:hypothetical protein
MTGAISGTGSTYFSEHSSSSLFLSGACVALVSYIVCFRPVWKESLNSNGQQFYKYQQNKQLPLATTH